MCYGSSPSGAGVWCSPYWAGNEEEWQTISLSIDHQIPSAMAVEHSSQGIALVELFAMDSGSGIERIEYAADGGATATYLEPLSFTVEGIHSVQYRALDRAGLYNPWQSVQTWVKPYNPCAGSADFEEDSSLGECEEGFFNQPLLVAQDRIHSVLEERFHALGRSNAGSYPAKGQEKLLKKWQNLVTMKGAKYEWENSDGDEC